MGKRTVITASALLMLFLVCLPGEAGARAPLVFHNTHDLFFRYPFGAMPADEEARLRVRSGVGDFTTAMVSVWDEVRQTRGQKPMELVVIDPEGDYEYWEISIGSETPTILRYHFVLTTEEGAVFYYGDPEQDGGIGRVTTRKPPYGFQLTVYDGNFRTPDWIKNAVMYQIFIDRFYDGDPANNRAAVERGFRGDWGLEFWEWGQLPENPREKGVNPDHVGDGIWNNDFFGGDLRGIIARLDHLQKLGVRALYLTPIFEAASNHKFDAADYRRIDRAFGTNEDFYELAKEARKRGIHLILDGVFNHVGEDSRYFDRHSRWPDDIGAYEYWAAVFNLMAKEDLSQAEAEARIRADFIAQGLTDFTFVDWFEIENRRINVGMVAVYGGERFYYEGWWGLESLPAVYAPGGCELNLTSFVDYIIRDDDSIARRWVEAGSSGWRLDVSPEMSHAFWAEFRRYLKGDRGPSCFPHGEPIILAEHWFDASRDFLGDTFDSTMNYRFQRPLIRFVLYGNAEALDGALMAVREDYPKEAFFALMNLLGTHDTARILTVFGYLDPELFADRDRARGMSPEEITRANELALRRLKLATILLFGYPGSPLIYYGDEVGVSGHACPDNRRTFPWERVHPENELLNHFLKLTAIRNENPVLRTGEIVTLHAQGEIYAIGRRLLGEQDALGRTEYVLNYYTGETFKIADYNALAIVVLNRDGEERFCLDLSGFADDGTVFIDLLNDGREYTVRGGAITLNVSPLWGAILIARHGPQDLLSAISLNE